MTSIKFFKKGICIIAVVCVAGLLLSSCGEKEHAKTESVIVLGTHNNAQPIDIKTNKLIDSTLDKVCRTGGKVSVIVADGSPFLAASYELTPPEKGVSDNVVEKHVATNKATLKEAIESSNPYAKTEETDTIEALKLAGRILSSSDSHGNKELLFLHTGLATAGILKDNLTANPDDLLKYLSDAKVALTFKDVKATLTHLGEVAGEQDSLTDAQLLNIENIYKGILENGGAEVTIDRSVTTKIENKDKDLPHVSVVEFPKQEVANLAQGEKAILDDSALTFYPNKAELIDEAKAKEVLSPYINQIKNGDLSVVVLGTTAKVGSRESSLSLSLERAKTISDLMADEGIKASDITTVGGGFDTSLHIKDTDKDGKLILSEATKNRRVILMNASSGEAKQIVAKHG